MSLATGLAVAKSRSKPRVSGDEPVTGVSYVLTGE